MKVFYSLRLLALPVACLAAAMGYTLVATPVSLGEGPVVKLVTEAVPAKNGPRMPVVTLAPEPVAPTTAPAPISAVPVSAAPAAASQPEAVAANPTPAHVPQPVAAEKVAVKPTYSVLSSAPPAAPVTAPPAAPVSPPPAAPAPVVKAAPAPVVASTAPVRTPVVVAALPPAPRATPPAVNASAEKIIAPQDLAPQRRLGPELPPAPVAAASPSLADLDRALGVAPVPSLTVGPAPVAMAPTLASAPSVPDSRLPATTPAPFMAAADAPSAPRVAEQRMPLALVADSAPAAPLAAPAGMTSECPPVNPVRCGVQCNGYGCEPNWMASRPIPWQVFAQGEYIGPARIAHVPEYRLRVDDTVEFIFRITASKVARAYRLEVGDRIKVQSLSNSVTEQEAVIQPDGTVTMSLLGQVPASGRTVDEMRQALDELYTKFVKSPSMTVIPVKFNTRLEELRATIDARAGTGGQRQIVRVTPEGTVQLSGIGSVFVQGLTLNEVKREVDERYTQLVDGFDVTPVLQARAPRYVYVLGEVRTPGRFTLEGPTTAMQAIAMAGSWNVGADLKRLVVFRRDECWQLMATRLDLHGAVFGKNPCPTDEIWLRDSDIVLVPKSGLLATDDALNLLFTRGIYAVFPINAQLNFSKLSTL